MPRSRIKRRRTHTKPSRSLSRMLVVVLVLLLVMLGITVLLGSSKNAKIEKVTKQIFYTPKLVSVGVISPYPTNYPNNNNVPAQKNYGFCLYVPVLIYHHIQPQADAIEKKETSLSVDNGIFDQQMAYLTQHGYTPIFANELAQALITHSQLPGKPIMVTMDDGYADNDIYALPVLKKYNIKANLMLATGLVGSNADMLSWSQVNDLKSSGLIYFTNHTWSHFSLTSGNTEKDTQEITIAQNQIKQNLGQDVNIITYPYGSFNDNVINLARSLGYVAGFSTIPGVYQCDSFIMSLHRTHIGNAPLSAYGF